MRKENLGFFCSAYNLILLHCLPLHKLHGLSPSSGLVSPFGGFASLFFDQVEYFASIKLCQALSRQGAIIKIPVVRCHYL